MITVAAARIEAAIRLDAKRAQWAGEIAGLGRQSNSAAYLRALQPPTENQVLQDQLAAETWAQQWRQVADMNVSTQEATRVDWQKRSWPSVGTQNVPIRLQLDTPDALAYFAGGVSEREWRELSARAAEISNAFGPSEELGLTVRKHAKRLLAYPYAEFQTVIRVVQWLRDNKVSGLRPRELPIRGVDSKWYSKNRSLVEGLHSACANLPLGVIQADHTVRIRVLDPELLDGVGLADFAAPIRELQRLSWQPQVVFIFENLESVLSMPSHPGAIVIFGSGYAAQSLGELPWLRNTEVIYWGDLDSHGFAVLHTLRKKLPQTRSVLMDQVTLLEHRDLWVREPTPHPGNFDTLTAAETETLNRLRHEGNVRLEQERIPWEFALTVLRNRSGETT